MSTKNKLRFLRISLALNTCALVLFIIAMITKLVILTIAGWILLIMALTVRYWYISNKDKKKKEKKNTDYSLVEVKSSEVLGIGDQIKTYWDRFIFWLNN
jgi:predicted membrane protein